ncbi:MAG: hypothetical protein WKF37_24675 [Bryobacteraceae bacterium]
MLVQNPKGSYSFLRGIAPYSAGVVADEGYEIVHARFQRLAPFADGCERVRKHLEQVSRPAQALCGMELRSPKPFTFQGFDEFNQGYIEALTKWGLIVDTVNPVARTNVAPEIGAPAAPSLYGFSYTVPSRTKKTTFVVAGAGELPEGSLEPKDLVRAGETSADALGEKIRFVMGLMSGRLRGLGTDWEQVATANVYTVHPICAMLPEQIVRPMSASAIHGVTWYYSRPPIVSIEYEMDVRGCEQELMLT